MTVYYIDSNAVGAQTGLTKADAFLSLADAFVVIAADDTLYFSHLHSHFYSANTVINLLNNTKMYSVDFTTDEYRRGAVEGTSGGNFDFSLITSAGRRLYIKGVSFSAQDDLKIPDGSDCLVVFEDLASSLTGISGADSMFGSTKDGQLLILKDVDLTFSASTQSMRLSNGKKFIFDNVTVTGTRRLFSSSSGNGGGTVAFKNCDFSAMLALTAPFIRVGLSSLDDVVSISMHQCKLPANVGTQGFIESPVGAAGMFLDVTSCTDGIDHDAYHYFLFTNYQGSVEQDLLTYLNATYDGITGFAITVDSSANALQLSPLEALLPEIAAFDASVSKTFTVEMVSSDPTLTDQDVWLEVSVNDSTDRVRGVRSTTQPADCLAVGVALSSSLAAWTGAGGLTKYQISLTIPAQAGVTNGNVLTRILLAKANTSVNIDPDFVIS